MMFKNERGQGLVEYAIIIVFVAIVVILVVTIFGPSVGDLFSISINSLPF
jgi:pilus assembly protein Flp/PilA